MTETVSPVAPAASEETHAPVTVGSVDHRAAARARGPVVLATDFGAVSVAAERVAIAMASSAGVPLVIVHAIDPGRLRLPGGRFRQRVDQARAAREHDTAAIVRRIWAAGVQAQVLVWEGDPATCVVEAARAEGAAAIVVGSHRRGRLGRILAGSVSSDIAEHADCPVHIVPGDGDRGGAQIATVRPASAAGDQGVPSGPRIRARGAPTRVRVSSVVISRAERQ